MPIYTYNCEEHGQFDKIKKIHERATAECPNCKQVAHLKIMAPAGVQGGYMDSSMSMTSSNNRKKLI